jgi:hypothetical protein
VLFEKHINKDAKVTKDEWKGYRPIAKDYDIEQIPSLYGLNFKALHTMIHQVKTGLRTIFSWVSPKHINRYFDEFSYRINRSQSKQTIFNNLINRMAASGKIYHKEIICS